MMDSGRRQPFLNFARIQTLHLLRRQLRECNLTDRGDEMETDILPLRFHVRGLTLCLRATTQGTAQRLYVLSHQIGHTHYWLDLLCSHAVGVEDT